MDLDLNKAKSIYQEMLTQGFKCWLYRDQARLSKNVSYIEREFPGSNVGLIVSSHINNPDGEYGKKFFGKQYRGSFVKATEVYSWYTEESKILKRVASEFLIQGIELEYPIVALIGDYYIKDNKWIVSENATDPGLNNLEEIIKNVYRVLLTRSRKGMSIYIPHDQKLDETYEWFDNMLNINK